MGYLVYCPTCSGKMSVNAEVCPHCGETAFFIRHDRNVPVEQPCDTGYGCPWQHCSGRGWYYRRNLEIVMVRTVFEGQDMSNVRRLKDGMEYRFSAGDLSDGKVAEALRTGGYAVEHAGHAYNPSWVFYYDRTVCPECGGRGKVRVWEVRSEWEDVRKPVK